MKIRDYKVIDPVTFEEIFEALKAVVEDVETSNGLHCLDKQLLLSIKSTISRVEK